MIVCSLNSAHVLAVLNQYPLMFIWGANKLPNILIAILIFLLLSQCKVNIGKFGYFLSTAVFGVYLLHNGPLLNSIIDFLGLNTLSHENLHYSSYVIGCALMIFLFGSIFEHIREFLFEKLISQSIVIVFSKKIDHFMVIINKVGKIIFQTIFECKENVR